MTGRKERKTAIKYRIIDDTAALLELYLTAMVLIPSALSPSISTMPLVISLPMFVKNAINEKIREEKNAISPAISPP